MYYAIQDEQRAELLEALIQAGFLNQLVVACDTNGWAVGLFNRGTPRSTPAHLLRGWIPMLRSRGFSEAQIQAIHVETPRRLLPF